jgi:negative regulator of sigma-B (phosphoserine phosphatase)
VAELLDVGVATATLPGEFESGDMYVVESHDGGMLVGAVDGLGHGSEAAHAARLACSVLEEEPGADVSELFIRCHSRLARSRGVVMSLATFGPDGKLVWLGVGNVEGTLLRGDGGRDSILLRGGVVGYQLPNLRPSTTTVEPGDTLVLATDGVDAGHLSQLAPAQAPQALADRLLTDHRKKTDDALVVVAQYLG